VHDAKEVKRTAMIRSFEMHRRATPAMWTCQCCCGFSGQHPASSAGCGPANCAPISGLDATRESRMPGDHVAPASVGHCDDSDVCSRYAAPTMNKLCWNGHTAASEGLRPQLAQCSISYYTDIDTQTAVSARRGASLRTPTEKLLLWASWRQAS
jgi:hypothetical protein